MKRTMFVLALIAVVTVAMTVTLAGCADEPDVTTETVDEIPEAAEDVYTEEPEEPGDEQAPGLDVEEMETDVPPPVREDEGGEEDNMDETG